MDIPESSNRPSGRLKPVLLFILAILLFAGIFLGLNYLKSNVLNNSSKHATQLTAEKRKVLEQQIAQYEKQANDLPSNAPKEARYNIYLRLARAKYQLELYPEALVELDKILEEDRGYPGVWYTYAEIYLKMNDTDKAKEYAKRAVESDSTNPQPWLLYIDLSKDLSNDSLNKLYAEAIKKTEHDLDIIIAYAKFLEKIGDKAGAIAQWQKAGQVDQAHKADYEAQIGRLQQ